jgi:hypothetical protein
MMCACQVDGIHLACALEFCESLLIEVVPALIEVVLKNSLALCATAQSRIASDVAVSDCFCFFPRRIPLVLCS